MMPLAWQRPFALARLAWSAVRLRTRRGPGKELARRRMVDRLARMHGLPQKIGQIIASAELDTTARDYRTLAVRPVSLDQAAGRALLARALGRRPENAFAHIDWRGQAASLAQVYRARLPDGREVALKLLHPRIAETLRADLLALGWLARPLGALRQSSRIDELRTALGHRLREELDLQAEARNLRRFRQAHREYPDLLSPEPIESCCTAELLTMTWLDGDALDTAQAWPEQTRQALCTALLRTFLRGLLCDHWLHADPNPGNYRFRSHGPGGLPAVVILDFGAMHAVTPSLGQALLRAARALRQGSLDTDLAWEVHRELGFDATLLAPLRAQLPALLRLILAPLADDPDFRLRAWHPGAALRALLGPHRMAYRLAAPTDFIFLIRAWHGLLRYLRALDSHVAWYPLLETIAPPAPVAAGPRPAPQGMNARALHLRVVRHGEERVLLTLPLEAADRLPELMPPDILARCAQVHPSPQAVAAAIRAAAYAEGPWFHLHEPDLEVRIWIG